MFTGIVEELGAIRAVRRGAASAVLSIGAAEVLSDLKIGDSVAVNGVCLTVTSLDDGGFTADVMHETLNRSSLGALAPGGRVNLERAMPANGRFGGHIVSGHIDGTGTVRRVRRDQNAVRFTIGAPAGIMELIVAQGSIAVDGISLTVADLYDDAFEVSVIPHTAAETTLGSHRPGSTVNLENDVVGKYVQRLLYNKNRNTGTPDAERADKPASPPLTLEYLAANGF